MKKINILIFLILTFSLYNCGGSSNTDVDLIENSSTADDPNSKGNEPIITFVEDSYDFGNMMEGEVVEHTFSFKNTGNKALLISEVQVSCGCTVPIWPREPIKPGKTGEIKVQFNSAGKHEQINKDVTIIANTNPIEKKLTFTAYVNAKKEE